MVSSREANRASVRSSNEWRHQRCTEINVSQDGECLGRQEVRSPAGTSLEGPERPRSLETGRLTLSTLGLLQMLLGHIYFPHSGCIRPIAHMQLGFLCLAASAGGMCPYQSKGSSVVFIHSFSHSPTHLLSTYYKS